MNKKTMLVDLDYVICSPGFLPIVNEFFDTDYEEDDFEEYIIDDIFGDRAQEFYDYYVEQDGYKDAGFKEGAKEVLERLSKYYRIHICSACVMFGAERKSAKLFADKYNFLIQQLPFLNPEDIIFTNSKNIFKADVQIDDRLQNLQGEVKTKLLFDAYHNRTITDEELQNQGVKRVKSWKEIENILLDNM